MSHSEHKDQEIEIDQLTWREQEVLLLLAERCSNREIAEQLHLAETTVKDYVSKILSKLYVKNRRQAVSRAAKLGLLADHNGGQGSTVNLPSEATPFVGRERELVEIRQLLADSRLLTLIGPGGIGKSRLAIKVAQQACEDFAHGVFFVPLAPLNSIDRIVQAITEAMKLPLMVQEDSQTQLLRFLQNKNLLLVMDNFEHLLDGVQIINEILQRAADVKILATSREKLNLVSEGLFIVGGMQMEPKVQPSDQARNDAGLLFIQSAQKVQPGFNPDGEQLSHIEAICDMVSGTPLAIELAAAWLQILTLPEIENELEHNLDLLSTGAIDAPERHRSMRAVFTHSWNLLSESEQDTLTRLSVFRGGFTRQAAQQVAGTSLQQLMSLVSKSFLTHDPDLGRLDFHELLRQYAWEQLAENEQEQLSIRHSHAVFFADFMDIRWSHLKDQRQIQALSEIRADIENVRAAWSCFLEENNAEQLWKFSKPIWLFFWIGGWHLAGTQLFGQAAQRLEGSSAPIDQAMLGLAMACQGYFLSWLDISEEGYQITKRGVEILSAFDHPVELTLALDCLAVNAYFMGRIKEMVSCATRMIDLARQVDEQWLLAFTLYAASLAAINQEEYLRSRRMAEEQLGICEEIGDSIGSVYSLITLGHIAFANGDNQLASKYYRRCERVSAKIGIHYALQTSTKYLGKVLINLGEHDEAQKTLIQCLGMTYNIGFVRDVINLYYEFARLRYALGRPLQAAELLAYVERHPYSDNYRMIEGRIRDSARNLLARIEAEVPRDDFQAAVLCGLQLEMEEIYLNLVN
jgi:predicted ATPase/DNA-binding CsgD family transcriptional regulator